MTQFQANNGVGTGQSVAASSIAPTSGSEGASATPDVSSPSPTKETSADRIRAILNNGDAAPKQNDESAVKSADSNVITSPTKPAVKPETLAELAIDQAAFDALPEKVKAKILGESKAAPGEPDMAELEAMAKDGSQQADPNAAPPVQQQPAVQQPPATPPANPNQPAHPFGFDPKVMQQFEAEYPELVGPILKPMAAMSQATIAMQQQNQQLQSMLMGLADHITGQTVENVLGSIEGAEELYGKGDEATEPQSKLRESVSDLAFALMNGAAKRNKPMSFKQALKHAHAMKNTDWVKARAEKAGIKKAQERQATVIQRVPNNPSTITNSDGQNWRKNAANRVAAALRKS